MSNWPESLPQYLMADATVVDDESRLTSQMDAGPASVRNRFTAITQTVKGSTTLTGAQLETFNTFYRTTLAHGSLTFTWTHPVTGAAATMRFKNKPQWSCILTSSTPDNRLWRGELELEILP